MHIFKERPLALSCCVFAAVAILARAMTASFQIICIIASILSLLVLTVLFFKTKARANFLAVLLLLATVFSLISSYLFFHVRYQCWQIE